MYEFFSLAEWKLLTIVIARHEETRAQRTERKLISCWIVGFFWNADLRNWNNFKNFSDFSYFSNLCCFILMQFGTRMTRMHGNADFGGFFINEFTI